MKNRPFLERFAYALRGIVWALRTERSFKTQFAFGIGAIAILFWFHAAPFWWALFFITIAAVLSAELINTAIEHIADRLHPEIHPMIGAAKDCAAGAVLVLSLASLGLFVAFLFEVLGKR